MKLRRILIAVVFALLAALLVMGTALADPSPEGRLRSAFNAILNGADAVEWVANDVAATHAAPVLGIYENRISLFNEGQVFCDDTVLGTWVTWMFGEYEWEDRAYIEASYSEITLDGELLELERSSIKRAYPTIHYDGYKFFSYTQGVPVLGTLEAGTHTLSWVGYLVDDTLYSDITFEVIHCGD
ncbi:MAG: hypothetical protein ACK2UW_13335 [Anaerolineales bacterium]|jgi:hypothetical protein